MKKFFLLLTIIVPFVVCGQSYYTSISQEYCSDKLIEQYDNQAKPYVRNPYSVARLVDAGTPQSVEIEILKGKDYKISFHMDSVIEDLGQVEYKIATEDGFVLYDNSEDLLAQEFEFTVHENYDIIINFKIPGNFENKKIGDGIYTKTTVSGCVVVLIEEMITPPKGF